MAMFVYNFDSELNFYVFWVLFYFVLFFVSLFVCLFVFFCGNLLLWIVRRKRKNLVPHGNAKFKIWVNSKF